MTNNWELGLSHASGDYVTFLGDDDGLLPDALEIARRFHEQWPDEILSWLPFTWLWPDSLAIEYRNLAQMHFGRQVRRVDSRAMLRDVLVGRSDWTTLPTLYCSFVPRTIIDKVKASQGRHFLASLPDVSSGITNLWFSNTYARAHRPLSCWGLSRHSTGVSQYFRVGSTGATFDRERVAAADEAWHRKVSGAELIVEARVADLYLKLKDRLFPNEKDLEVDMAVLLRRVADQAALRLHANRDEVGRHVEEMARRNGLDPADFPLAEPAGEPQRRFAYSIMSDQDMVSFAHHTDPRHIATIEDFVDYAARMCVAPQEIAGPDDAAEPGNFSTRFRAMTGRLRRLRR